MKIKEFNNAHDFAKECERFLLKSESFYNLKLGLTQSIKENKLETTSPLYLGIFEENKIIGCALRTNIDKPLSITKLSRKAIEKIIEHLFNKNVTLSAVVGEVESATYFKDIWILKTNKNFRLNIHLGLYENYNLIMPNTSGTMILGTEKEKAIIKNFIKGFTEDCFPNTPYDDERIEKMCNQHIKNKSLYLLKDQSDEIVAMAANTRSSLNGGTISLVYTPPQFRAKGYGSLITALVTRKILEEKKFASLFTDLTNPTSNSIYQKIGFQKIGENIHFDFE